MFMYLRGTQLNSYIQVQSVLRRDCGEKHLQMIQRQRKILDEVDKILLMWDANEADA